MYIKPSDESGWERVPPSTACPSARVRSVLSFASSSQKLNLAGRESLQRNASSLKHKAVTPGKWYGKASRVH